MEQCRQGIQRLSMTVFDSCLFMFSCAFSLFSRTACTGQKTLLSAPLLFVATVFVSCFHHGKLKNVFGCAMLREGENGPKKHHSHVPQADSG